MSLHGSRPCLAHTDDEYTRCKMTDHRLLEIVTPKSHSQEGSSDSVGGEFKDSILL